MAKNVEIGRGIYGLDKLFGAEFTAAQDRIGRMYRLRYAEQIVKVGAYDTGALSRSIGLLDATREGTIRVLEVESDRYRDAAVAARRPQGIGDIIERGRRPPVNYPGRYPALRAVEESDPWVIHTLQDAARDAIKKTQQS